MKCLLYIPPFECAGTRVSNIAEVRVGGLTLYQRACRCLQKAGFDEIVVAKPDTLILKDDALVKITITPLDYKLRVTESSEPMLKIAEAESDPVFVCVLDGMISAECFKLKPETPDVRIIANDEQTGIYYVCKETLIKILNSDGSLEQLDSEISETFNAPEKTVYHRILSSDDTKIAQNVLTRSLRKPLGRDADGLVAYFINRPCSLQISKRIANSFITPNMVTAIGLVIGLAGAALMFFGTPVFMVTGAILWQISSMVDGIDGELARMRLSPSHSGEWFDTVADDVTNITFLVGLGHALAVVNKEMLYFYVACGVGALMVIAVLWFYREFVKMGIASHNHFEWGFESENKANKENEQRSVFRKVVDAIAGGFAWIAKRDFYTFLIMCLVIVGLYKPAYFIMLAGASCVGIGGLVALSLRAVRNARKK